LLKIDVINSGEALRCALVLSCLKRIPFKVVNLSGEGRGLNEEHLAAVRTLGRIADAKIEGNRAGSSELCFVPSNKKPAVDDSEIHFAVRSPVPAVPVLQAAILASLGAGSSRQFRLKGCTELRSAQGAGYAIRVWSRVLSAIGIRVNIERGQIGFAPAGGGRMSAVLLPLSGELMPLDARQRATLRGIQGRILVSRLANDIALRCRQKTESLLQEQGLYGEIEIERSNGVSGGLELELVADFSLLAAGFTVVKESGTSPEEVAEGGVGLLSGFLASGAAVQSHLAEQIALPLALCPGISSFSTDRISERLIEVLTVVRAFLPHIHLGIDGRVGSAGTVTVSA
jgi:RNA 3'-terminal phosphate cyclase (ATP)